MAKPVQYARYPPSPPRSCVEHAADWTHRAGGSTLQLPATPVAATNRSWMVMETCDASTQRHCTTERDQRERTTTHESSSASSTVHDRTSMRFAPANISTGYNRSGSNDDRTTGSSEEHEAQRPRPFLSVSIAPVPSLHPKRPPVVRWQ
jgi:hypothetical protein